jgi:hypothetical protein
MEQSTVEPESAEALRNGIALSDKFVFIDDPNDPGTIHCIPKALAIAALRLIAVSSAPPAEGSAHGH